MDTAQQMNGKDWVLSTCVNLNLKYEMLAYLMGGTGQQVFHCPKMEFMAVPYLCQTQVIKLYEFFPMKYFVYVTWVWYDVFFFFSTSPPPSFSLSSLSPEAYSLWKCISYLGNLNVIFFMSRVWCSIKLIYRVVRNSCHDWWNRRLYYDFYIHLCGTNTYFPSIIMGNFLRSNYEYTCCFTKRVDPLFNVIPYIVQRKP